MRYTFPAFPPPHPPSLSSPLTLQPPLSIPSYLSPSLPHSLQEMESMKTAQRKATTGHSAVEVRALEEAERYKSELHRMQTDSKASPCIPLCISLSISTFQDIPSIALCILCILLHTISQA